MYLITLEMVLAGAEKYSRSGLEVLAGWESQEEEYSRSWLKCSFLQHSYSLLNSYLNLQK